MVGLSPWQRSAVSWTEVLNACIDACARGDMPAFASLIDAHSALVQLHYHDFFSAGVENPHAEWFLMKLLQLDVLKNDEKMGAIHMSFIRSLHTRGYVGCEACVRVICQHYGQNSLNNVLEYHGTLACGYDPTFRPNMTNQLIVTLHHVKMGYIEEGLALSLLKLYVDYGVNVDARYKLDNGKSAVHFAAENGLWDSVELLLKHDAIVDYNYEGIKARDLIEKCKPHLLENIANTNIRTSLTDILFNALYAGDEEQFMVLYEEAMYQKLKFEEDDSWYTLVQLAVIKNLKNALTTILKYNTKSVKNISGLKDTAILLATERGHFEIVLELLKCEHVNYLVTGDFGDTILHKLARAVQQNVIEEGSDQTALQIIELLLQKNEVDINSRNQKNETVLKLFLDTENLNILRLLLKKGAFLSADPNVLNDLHNKDLRSVLDSAITTRVNSKGDKIVDLDFECFNLQPQSNKRPEMLTLYKISKSAKHANLLAHPLIKTFLHLKWLKIYWIYFINLMLFFSFVAFLTTYIYYSTSQIHAPISFTFSVISYIYVLTRELFQILMSPQQYFRKFENWLHVISLTLTFIFLIFGPNILLSFNVLFIYIEFSLLLGRHPSIASYIAMFQKVFKVNILLLAISLPFVCSFAICFNILFKSDTMFQNPINSLFITLIMSTGEFELESLEFGETPIVSEIIFLLFVVCIHIILMNLLHALAVHDTEGIQRDAELVSLNAKTALYANIEAAWHGFPIRWYFNAWGDSSANRLKLSERLKSVISISVLPFSDDRNCIISIREDGTIINGSDDEGRINLYPGPKILKPLIKIVTGVNVQNIFSDCSGNLSKSRNEINEKLQNLRLKLVLASETHSREIQELKSLILYQNNLIENLQKCLYQNIQQN